MESVRRGGHSVGSLLLQINFVALSDHDLRRAPGRCSIKSEAAGMKIRTFKSKARVLCQELGLESLLFRDE